MRKKPVIIIGSSTIGIQAALEFADLGFKVHLVETGPFLEHSEEGVLTSLEQNTRQLQLSRHPNITLWTDTNISRLRGTPGNLKVELRQHPRYVDLQRCTSCGDCIEVCPVTVPGTTHKAIYLDGQPGCLAIDKIGISPCANTCPGGIHVQGYIALIAQGRFQEAIDLIRQAIPFPGICGRVCTHPCEVNCRRTEIDQPVAVRLLKRFVTDWDLAQSEREGIHSRSDPDVSENQSKTQPRVAVVGAGPGGMAVANSLVRNGCQVTVYEKLPVIGGMMAVGIPRYRLPREVIEREYQYILNQGVRLQLNTAIGPDGCYSLDDLFDMGYQAVCLAVGAHRSQTLNIPGENLNGVLHGIEVLKQINIDQESTGLLPRGVKTRFAIIGGGNTAMDVARSLLRLGAAQVRVLYRRTHKEMPAMPEEVEEALQEGVEIEFLVSPVRILGDHSSDVTGLECIRMQLGEPDASGRRRPMPIAGSEFVLDLDRVILAIGQSPNLEFLDPQHDIAITRDHRINVSDSSFMTSRPGVFAVGDAVTRDKMAVIEAIGMGKQAAEGIMAYLNGKAPQAISFDAHQVPVAHRELSIAEQVPRPRNTVPTIPMEIRKTSFKEVETGFTAEQAIAEAKRCLACGPCSECQACIQVCQPGAIFHEQREKIAEIDAGAIIIAKVGAPGDLPAPSDKAEERFLTEEKGFFPLMDKDPFFVSSVITRVLPYLLGHVDSYPVKKNLHPNHISFTGASYLDGRQTPSVNQPNRCGVFICQCGLDETGKISSVIDTKLVVSKVASWPGVIHTRVLPFSCSPEGAHAIETAVEDHKLNRVVVAGCTCCSIDQVCDSCTYQRVRCKENLLLFSQPERSSALGISDSGTKFVFINIREQCAWVHQDDPKAATAKTTAMIAGAVARVMSAPIKFPKVPVSTRSTILLGSSSIPMKYAAVLEKFGVEVQIQPFLPDKVLRSAGQYNIFKGDQTWRASTLVFLPKDDEEVLKIKTSFENPAHKPAEINISLGTKNHRTGAFIVPPGCDPMVSAKAVASRIDAWLQQIETQPQPASFVDPSRCRACGTCTEICEFGAPEILQYDHLRASWIDPALCQGCGICAAHCPSGAITPGYSTDAQIDAMLSAVLSHPM